MAGHVCPWWGGYFIDNRLRRLLHDPARIIGLYVKPGMTVLDVGCGMGMFSIAMARMVGDSGSVIAADLQQQMLDVLMQRAAAAGVAERIRTQLCQADRISVEIPVDFALAFAVAHEAPDAGRFLEQVDACLKPGGRFLLAEPRLHVPFETFQAMLTVAKSLGWKESERPSVRLCRAVVFAKQQGSERS